MPTKDFIALCPYTDEQGKHAKGDVVSLPFGTIYEKMDANRLVDYGVLAEHDRPKRKTRKD
jgi:hypothetical protein